MKIVTAFGEDTLWEKKLAKVIGDVIGQLYRATQGIEFWIPGCHNPFYRHFTYAVLGYKDKHPDQEVHIVDVAFSPERGEGPLSLFHQEMTDSFPLESISRVVYAPRKLMPGGDKVSTYSKIEKWIVSQCDYLIAYFYDNLPDSTLRKVQQAQRKHPDLQMIHVSIPEARELIEQGVKDLTPREKIVYEAARKGLSFRAVADTIGVSAARASQIADQACRKLREKIQNQEK